MVRKSCATVFCFFLSVILFTGVCDGRQPPVPGGAVTSCPSQPPGVYIEDARGWTPLSAATPSKMKAKHAFLSSVTEGAVAAPVIVEYANPHAAVAAHRARPTICVSHLTTTAPPMLVRLDVKKKTRELDSGTVRAFPFGDTSRQGHAEASSLVSSTTQKPEYGIVLLSPQTNLDSGEYAVMFGASNLAIFDFGVDAGDTSQK